MSGNSFGSIFRVTTYGESHGGAVGVVVDGATPGVDLCEADIQCDLDRRRPGQSDVTTPRAETDTVRILSGVFEGKTTGTPILLIIQNRDARPSAYDEIKDLFRPGHADYTYFLKYGIRDYRGSGRASGRETAGRVAAGAIARKLLSRRGITIRAYTKRAAGIECKTIDFDEIERNIVRACDPEAAREIVAKIQAARDEENSVGGIVECRVSGVPAGLGEPVFDKLEADLAKAVMSIGATRGIEFGLGFALADMTGKESNDEMDADGFVSNNCGGVLGGISTGDEIVFRVVFKPTSSIAQPQRTVDKEGAEVICRTEGRHDPSIFPRAVPVVEAMVALVLEDHCKRHAALHA
ncbi:MAG: chorismate synthase [Lentisphaerae bacterium]|jgi:chorismate synthase|nr:chorismate synthase [Lentisphaerota bacterium]MBT4821441.1 chorismate synthase [Lentisphaerota bacterium]MBT5607819.1 chorismate synthase [Lentisphaerota bacterium]MBT7057838.1 chorismate synthase [Lentisphaerota bacterium]MBT7841122.1 chorismate synthase [Lentisphaerota bacterium]